MSLSPDITFPADVVAALRAPAGEIHGRVDCRRSRRDGQARDLPGPVAAAGERGIDTDDSDDRAAAVGAAGQARADRRRAARRGRRDRHGVGAGAEALTPMLLRIRDHTGASPDRRLAQTSVRTVPGAVRV